MFREEFAKVISATGMVPIKDLRPLMIDRKEDSISEFDLLNLSFLTIFALPSNWHSDLNLLLSTYLGPKLEIAI